MSCSTTVVRYMYLFRCNAIRFAGRQAPDSRHGRSHLQSQVWHGGGMIDVIHRGATETASSKGGFRSRAKVSAGNGDGDPDGDGPSVTRRRTTSKSAKRFSLRLAVVLSAQPFKEPLTGFPALCRMLSAIYPFSVLTGGVFRCRGSDGLAVSGTPRCRRAWSWSRQASSALMR